MPNRVPLSVRHHSLLLSNRCTIRIHIGTTLAAQSVQTVRICHSFTANLQQSSDYLPTIHQLFNHLYSHLQFIITTDHYLEQSIYTVYSSLTDFHYNQLTIISICQYVMITISILYIFTTLPYTAVSHLIQIIIFSHPTIVIFIMETVFRANHQKFPLCIIIHLLFFVIKFI